PYTTAADCPRTTPSQHDQPEDHPTRPVNVTVPRESIHDQKPADSLNQKAALSVAYSNSNSNKVTALTGPAEVA
ncbi:hypothetical protein, partial [Streptomyces sp. NPDC097610]|uniref:hypothetical protein n=1 Tax=Streptomyces sp. NPDC097610 TaxID=3157227 RepID=UPI00332A6BAF